MQFAPRIECGGMEICMRKKDFLAVKRLLTILLVLCFIISPWSILHTDAAGCEKYNAKTDVDYTDGKGADVVLEHKEEQGGSVTASYAVDDTRLTRNATYYMSMKVKFSNSHSWAIRLRNVTCKINGETVTGDMQFHVFDKQGTLQVAGKSIDNWPRFTNIEDNAWHTITVRSTVDSFEFWVDGTRATGLYYNANVTDMTTNYTCPKVIISGLNTGTVKDIYVWNDGKEENPIMPADKVAQSIEGLPDAVSVKKSDQSKVQKVVAAYEALEEAEKKYVLNYDKLQQVVKALGSGDAYDIRVSGSKEGSFESLFPKNVISHTEADGNTKYYFETKTGRNATYYTQFVVNLSSESNCFDVYLRNQKHTIDGKSVSGVISLRLFKNSAAVVDSGQNRLSEWANYKTNIFEGGHVITVESSPTSCALWIDEVRYEVPDYLSNVTGSAECIQATTGFYMSKTVEGTISDVRVWSNENTYSAGDKVRVAIFELPDLNKVTLDDKAAIAKVQKSYDKLSQTEQKYVTNLSRLEKLERTIALIEAEGDSAYNFLRDELPVVQSDYINLISTGTLSTPATYSSKVTYNAATHDIRYLESESYITSTFTDLQGIGANDRYLIKFTYKPYEYYYETPTAAWMGLRITFSGYEVGGNGAKTINKTQFAFMTNQCAVISRANGNAMPTNYLPTFATEVGKEYQVSMLCEQGRMKIWVNGEPIAYFDELPAYPMKLEFESSRCKCDVTNIQLYNLSNPTEPELTASEEGGFKMIADSLYDVEGIIAKDRVDQKKQTWILSLILFAVILVVSAIVVAANVIRKPKRLNQKKEEAVKNVKEENH